MLMFSFCSGLNFGCWFIEPQKGLGNKAGFQYDESVAGIVDLL